MNPHSNSGIVDPAWVTEVLHFWFDEVGKAHWFAKTADVDEQVRARFLSLHKQLVADQRFGATAPRQLLAAVIVLDQFSRNLFRGTSRAFAADAIARRLSRTAISQRFDVAMTAEERLFLYLPFEHSEYREDQALSVKLFERLGNPEWTRFALEHKAIIDRFGRHPHRNAMLNRHSSADEVAFLQNPTEWS